MTLDDQLNPNDGSLIDTIDNILFDFSKKIAKKWQDTTYRDKADLEKALYYGSAAGYIGYGVNSKNYFMLISSAYLFMQGSSQIRTTKSNREEEISLEALGLPSKSLKYVRAIMCVSGIISLAKATGYALVGAKTGNSEYYMKSLEEVSWSIGNLGWTAADYIAKVDIGPPPRRPKKKPVIEQIKESLGALLPHPIPQTVPINNYSEK